MLDAGDMVDLAKKWHALPERFHCNAGALSGQLYALLNCTVLDCSDPHNTSEIWTHYYFLKCILYCTAHITYVAVSCGAARRS